MNQQNSPKFHFDDIDVYVSEKLPEWWDDYPSAGRDFFQSSAWGLFLEKTAEMKPIYIFAKKNDSITGVLLAYYTPLRLRKKEEGGTIVASVPSLRWHQGPVLSDPNDKNVLYALVKTLLSERKIKLKIHGDPPYIYQPEIGEQFPFVAKELGLKSKKWATYVLDVQKPVDDLWNSIRGKERTAIRKLRKADLEIKWLKEKDIESYFALLKKYRKGSKLTLPPFYPNKILWEILGEEKLKMPSVFINNEVQSIFPIIIFNNVCKFFALAQNPDLVGPDRSINDIIQWNIIERLSIDGIKYYDFAGVSPNPLSEKEKGIKHFKAKWGGNYIEYNYITANIFS